MNDSWKNIELIVILNVIQTCLKMTLKFYQYSVIYWNYLEYLNWMGV